MTTDGTTAHASSSAAGPVAAGTATSTVGQGSAGRGAFIVLEGIDRCGKTTQIKRLMDELRKQNISAEAIRFPDRSTTIGKMINDYLAKGVDLDDHAIHLLFSANRWEAVASLEAKLAAGTTLVCDRYAFSGVAFSAAKAGLSFDWCKECDRGLPAPDAVIYLDISVEDASERGQYGEERYETREMQARVRDNFMRLKAADPGSWHVVDATLPIEEVTEGVMKAAMQVLQEAPRRPLNRLWP